jgi:hypothetical protein
MDNRILYLLIILSLGLIVFVIKQNMILNENFISSKETPAEKGIAFGYVPINYKTSTKIKTIKNPKAIHINESINIFSNNKYLGFNNKNQLLPGLFDRLGTFTPYIYESIKIHSKDSDDVIYYNKTVVTFTITHLHEKYYLRYIPNTNTFYLSSNPSFFQIINAIDSYKNSEVLYDDSIIIKCLDNSEYLLGYNEFIVTEKNKSSTFVIKKTDVPDICVNFNKSNNFMPNTLDPIQTKLIKTNYKEAINNHISKLTGDKLNEINRIKANIKELKTKLANVNTMQKIQVQQLKTELEYKLKTEQDSLNNEIIKYKEDKNQELSKYLDGIKKTKWENELANLKMQINKTCEDKKTQPIHLDENKKLDQVPQIELNNHQPLQQQKQPNVLQNHSAVKYNQTEIKKHQQLEQKKHQEAQNHYDIQKHHENELQKHQNLEKQKKNEVLQNHTVLQHHQMELKNQQPLQQKQKHETQIQIHKQLEIKKNKEIQQHLLAQQYHQKEIKKQQQLEQKKNQAAQKHYEMQKHHKNEINKLQNIHEQQRIQDAQQKAQLRQKRVQEAQLRQKRVQEAQIRKEADKRALAAEKRVHLERSKINESISCSKNINKYRNH